MVPCAEQGRIEEAAADDVILGIGVAERRAAIAADEPLGTMARDQGRLVPQRGGPGGLSLMAAMYSPIAAVVVGPTTSSAYTAHPSAPVRTSMRSARAWARMAARQASASST